MKTRTLALSSLPVAALLLALAAAPAAGDSGLLYYCVGPQGGKNGKGPWMESLECQIQEHDCGDFYSVGGPIVDVEGQKNDKGAITYKKGGDKFTGLTSRLIRDADHE